MAERMTPLTDAEIAEMERQLEAAEEAPWKVSYQQDQTGEYEPVANWEVHDQLHLELCANLRNAAPQLLASAREANRLRATVEILGKLIHDEIGPARLLELGWKVALSSTAPDDGGGAGRGTKRRNPAGLSQRGIRRL